MSNFSPQKNARIPEQNISLRNLCKNFWLEETAILDMQMSKLPIEKFVTTIYNIGKIYTPNAQIHDPSLSWLGTGTSVINGKVKLVLRAQTSTLKCLFCYKKCLR